MFATGINILDICQEKQHNSEPVTDLLNKTKIISIKV